MLVVQGLLVGGAGAIRRARAQCLGTTPHRHRKCRTCRFDIEVVRAWAVSVHDRGTVLRVDMVIVIILVVGDPGAESTRTGKKLLFLWLRPRWAERWPTRYGTWTRS